MNDNKSPSRYPVFPVAMAGGLGYLAKYSAYNFLTFVILLCFGGLAFAYITFFAGKIPFWSLLAPLIPFDESGNATIGASDILWVYSLVSLVFMVLGIALNALITRVKREVQRMRGSGPVEPSPPVHSRGIRSYFRAALQRKTVGCGVITLIFLAAFIAVPSAKMAEGSSPAALFGVLGIFYILAMICNGAYILIDVVSDFILDWARSNFPWPSKRVQVA